MMIVKERSCTAVLAAFAWIAVVYLWQSGSFEHGSSASVGAPQASHTEPVATIRAAALSHAGETELRAQPH